MVGQTVCTALLYNLRSDPFERGPSSQFYGGWQAHRMFLLVPAQAIVGIG